MKTERHIEGVRKCRGCPDRKSGCKKGCEDYAVRRIVDTLALPEIRAAVKLGEDLRAVKHRDMTRNARKKMHTRRR